ncbi:glutathione peroxidase [Salinarimonas sp.]|uniref:glutathione peroxidase n=1 Tax=Salinarimonas sp. TaxID=2766526 RepID=UPI00391BB612
MTPSILRRSLIRSALLVPAAMLASVALAATAPRAQAGDAVSSPTAHAFSFAGIEGGRIDLAAFAGRPILVVNTASRCGFTGQLAGLQTLHERFGERGLVVIGVPSNDFRQELDDNAAVAAFCQGRFGVTFPMAEISSVRGAQAHPFYRWAARERPGEAPRWNFHKYLIGPDGRISATFATTTEPTDPRVIAAIERLVGQGS